MDEEKAKAYVLRLIAKRAYTTGQIREKLAKKGAAPATADRLVSHFSRLGYLDDRLYAERFAEEKARKGYGPRWIEWALRLKRVDPKTIKESVSGGGDGEAARRALGASRLKMRSGEDPRRHAARLFSFLVRRGFSGSVSRAAVQKALRVDPED